VSGALIPLPRPRWPVSSLQLQVGPELTSVMRGNEKKGGRTPPRGTFLGRRLLALDALLERLIFLALPSILLQDLFERRNQKTKRKTRHSHANIPSSAESSFIHICECARERVNIYVGGER